MLLKRYVLTVLVLGEVPMFRFDETVGGHLL